MPRLDGEMRRSRAGRRFGRFARGSPIPIKTRLSGRRPAMREASRTCPMISAVVRFRRHPSIPLAQNLHPYAQPTWLETQRVRRELRLPSSPCVAGISTDSTYEPSPNFQRNFRVVSSDPWMVTGSAARSRKREAREVRRGRERSVISSYEETKRWRTQVRICFSR